MDMIDRFSPVDRSRMIPTLIPSPRPQGLPAVNDATLEQFLAACGSSEPLRLGVGQRDELMSDTQLIRQPFVVIGRRPECDLVLDHWQVSRRHAYLQLIEGRYYCIDLGSRTGTHGGDSAERSGWLERGRAIQIGPYAVRPEAASSSARTSGPSLAVTWELPGRAVGQALWRMDRHLALVGRAPACKIRIVEPDVSKFHCSLVLTPQGVWAVDLLSQKGMLINDEPIRCARIEDGDEVRIGRHILRARYDTPPRPLPRTRALAERKNGPTPPRLDPMPSPTMSAGSSVTGPTELVLPPPNYQLPAVFAPGGGGGAIDPSVNILVHQFGMMQQQMFDQFHQTMMMMFEGFAALHREQASTLRSEFDEVRKLSEEIESLRRETARLADEAAKGQRARPTNGYNPPATSSPRPQNQPPRASGPAFPKASMPEPDPNVDIHSQLLLRLSTIQSERQNRWQKILGMMSSKS
jgi:pSer/pThr/pTyr-binding forkhead associated (FHA) protein